MQLRVLTWNLFHGRSVPPSGRDLQTEFTAALASWEWDVALLQEVPPWWPPLLAAALGAEQRSVLTSRNAGRALRRALAVHVPDLMRSSGGGANAILVRSDRIVGDAAQRLTWLPERRWVHGVELAAGVWVANLHATAHDTTAAQRDLAAAAAAASRWAGSLPVVLGGDFNLRSLHVDGMEVVADSDVDHVLIGPGIDRVAPAERLERGGLSDHVPLAVSLSVSIG